MHKEKMLSDVFLKQFKTGEELNSFLAELQKRGFEKILEGELDAHLGQSQIQVPLPPLFTSSFTLHFFLHSSLLSLHS